MSGWIHKLFYRLKWDNRKPKIYIRVRRDRIYGKFFWLYYDFRIRK